MKKLFKKPNENIVYELNEQQDDGNNSFNINVSDIIKLTSDIKGNRIINISNFNSENDELITDESLNIYPAEIDMRLEYSPYSRCLISYIKDMPKKRVFSFKKDKYYNSEQETYSFENIGIGHNVTDYNGNDDSYGFKEINQYVENFKIKDGENETYREIKIDDIKNEFPGFDASVDKWELGIVEYSSLSDYLLDTTFEIVVNEIDKVTKYNVFFPFHNYGTYLPVNYDNVWDNVNCTLTFDSSYYGLTENLRKCQIFDDSNNSTRKIIKTEYKNTFEEENINSVNSIEAAQFDNFNNNEFDMSLLSKSIIRILDSKESFCCISFDSTFNIFSLLEIIPTATSIEAKPPFSQTSDIEIIAKLYNDITFDKINDLENIIMPSHELNELMLEIKEKAHAAPSSVDVNLIHYASDNNAKSFPSAVFKVVNENDIKLLTDFFNADGNRIFKFFVDLSTPIVSNSESLQKSYTNGVIFSLATDYFPLNDITVKCKCAVEVRDCLVCIEKNGENNEYAKITPISGVLDITSKYAGKDKLNGIYDTSKFFNENQPDGNTGTISQETPNTESTEIEKPTICDFFYKRMIPYAYSTKTINLSNKINVEIKKDSFGISAKLNDEDNDNGDGIIRNSGISTEKLSLNYPIHYDDIISCANILASKDGSRFFKDFKCFNVDANDKQPFSYGYERLELSYEKAKSYKKYVLKTTDGITLNAKQSTSILNKSNEKDSKEFNSFIQNVNFSEYKEFYSRWNSNMIAKCLSYNGETLKNVDGQPIKVSEIIDSLQFINLGWEHIVVDGDTSIELNDGEDYPKITEPFGELSVQLYGYPSQIRVFKEVDTGIFEEILGDSENNVFNIEPIITDTNTDQEIKFKNDRVAVVLKDGVNDVNINFGKKKSDMYDILQESDINAEWKTRDITISKYKEPTGEFKLTISESSDDGLYITKKIVASFDENTDASLYNYQWEITEGSIIGIEDKFDMEFFDGKGNSVSLNDPYGTNELVIKFVPKQKNDLSVGDSSWSFKIKSTCRYRRPNELNFNEVCKNIQLNGIQRYNGYNITVESEDGSKSFTNKKNAYNTVFSIIDSTDTQAKIIIRDDGISNDVRYTAKLNTKKGDITDKRIEITLSSETPVLKWGNVNEVKNIIRITSECIPELFFFKDSNINALPTYSYNPNEKIWFKNGINDDGYGDTRNYGNYGIMDGSHYEEFRFRSKYKIHDVKDIPYRIRATLNIFDSSDIQIFETFKDITNSTSGDNDVELCWRTNRHIIDTNKQFEHFYGKITFSVQRSNDSGEIIFPSEYKNSIKTNSYKDEEINGILDNPENIESCTNGPSITKAERFLNDNSFEYNCDVLYPIGGIIGQCLPGEGRPSVDSSLYIKNSSIDDSIPFRITAKGPTLVKLKHSYFPLNGNSIEHGWEFDTLMGGSGDGLIASLFAVDSPPSDGNSNLWILKGKNNYINMSFSKTILYKIVATGDSYTGSNFTHSDWKEHSSSFNQGEDQYILNDDDVDGNFKIKITTPEKISFTCRIGTTMIYTDSIPWYNETKEGEYSTYDIDTLMSDEVILESTGLNESSAEIYQMGPFNNPGEYYLAASGYKVCNLNESQQQKEEIYEYNNKKIISEYISPYYIYVNDEFSKFSDEVKRTPLSKPIKFKYDLNDISIGPNEIITNSVINSRIDMIMHDFRQIIEYSKYYMISPYKYVGYIGFGKKENGIPAYGFWNSGENEDKNLLSSKDCIANEHTTEFMGSTSMYMDDDTGFMYFTKGHKFNIVGINGFNTTGHEYDIKDYEEVNSTKPNVDSIAFLSNGKIVMVAPDFNRVIVYSKFDNNRESTSDCKFLYDWGGYGGKKATLKFNNPIALDVYNPDYEKYNEEEIKSEDTSEVIFVLDAGNHCVKEYTEFGSWINTFEYSVIEDEQEIDIAVGIDGIINVLTNKRVITIDISTNNISSYSFNYAESSLLPIEICKSKTGKFVYIAFENDIIKFSTKGIYICSLSLSKKWLKINSDSGIPEKYGKITNIYVSKLNEILIKFDKVIISYSDDLIEKSLVSQNYKRFLWNENDIYVKKNEYVQDWVINTVLHRLHDNINLFKRSLFARIRTFELNNAIEILSEDLSETEYSKLKIVDKGDIFVASNSPMTSVAFNNELKKLYDALEMLRSFT